MPADPAAIAAAIAGALARLPDLRPHWVRPRRGQRPPQRAAYTRRPRLTIVVAGERRVLAPVDGEVRDLRLRPGDALVVGADGWSVPGPGPANRIIALNCHDAFTHFEAPTGAVFQSGRPLRAAAWSLLGALVHLGDDRGQRRHGPDLLRLAVTVALGDCRAEDGDPARRAWNAACALAQDRLDAGRDALAAAAGVHPNHLSRLCRRFEGVSLIGWLTALRMERARRLLREGMDAAHVAPACGFAEPSHFRRTFRRQHGLPPAAWVARQR